MVDRQRLEELLGESLDALTISCSAFDQGHLSEAKRLAVTIRVLVHDTKSSKSLLGQLGVKDSMQFLDTASDLDPSPNVFTSGALTTLRVSAGDAEHLPRLDGRQGTAPLVSFETWWGKLVMKGAENSLWTRKKLILALANKEGGAHVDPMGAPGYADLVNPWLGLIRVNLDTGQSVPLDATEALPSVRQIAHEVLRSFQAQFGIPPGASPDDASQ